MGHHYMEDAEVGHSAPEFVTADKVKKKTDFIIEGIALVKLARMAKQAVADKKKLILVLDTDDDRVVDCYEQLG